MRRRNWAMRWTSTSMRARQQCRFRRRSDRPAGREQREPHRIAAGDHLRECAGATGRCGGRLPRCGPDNSVGSVVDQIGPLAVSSANRTGLPPATTCENAQAQLGDAVDVYLDAGPTTVSVPSSIVDVTGPVPVLVRPGWISVDRLREI